MLKVRTLFSGIGSPEIALRDLQMPYELMDFCENDKYAITSYCAIHGVSKDKNLGDITKVWGRNLPYADLMIWGFPCTDISVAGKQAGIVEGTTRSGLYYEGLRVLRETKPKYSIIENVKNLTGKQFKAEFEQMLKDIGDIGYNNYWKVLDAKDYGIPQHRERVFIVSIRKDIDIKFEFPQAFDNGLRLKDFLEDEVDEKFYVSEKMIAGFEKHNIHHNAKGTGFIWRPTDTNGVAKTLRANAALCPTDNTIIQVGELNIKGMDCIKRVYSEDGIAPTLTSMEGGNRQPKVLKVIGSAQKNAYIGNGSICPTLTSAMGMGGGQTPMVEKLGYRIRKLTPRECWRLMGFTDEDFQKATDAGVSNSQLYKQAGNSIVSNVLKDIFAKLLQTEIARLYEDEKELS